MEESELNFNSSVICIKCLGPFHEATGHIFSGTERFCGICAGKFFAWMFYANRGWHYSDKKKTLVRDTMLMKRRMKHKSVLARRL